MQFIQFIPSAHFSDTILDSYHQIDQTHFLTTAHPEDFQSPFNFQMFVVLISKL